MKLRRVLAFILAAAMLLGLCAGCGKKPEEMYDEALYAMGTMYENGLGVEAAAQALADLAAEPAA